MEEVLGAWLGHAPSEITWWQMSLRALVVFAYGLVLVRLAGNRAFGRYSALDILVAVLIGSNLSRALTGNANLFPTLFATTLLIVLHRALATLAALVPAIGPILKGRRVCVVRDGEPDGAAMRRHGLAMGDLEEAIRIQAMTDDLGEIRCAWLERSGDISVIKRG